MPKKNIPIEPKHPAFIEVEQIPNAIKKLERRLADFEQATTGGTRGSYYDQASALCSKLDSTLADIFGVDSMQYEQTRVTTSDFSLGYFVMGGGGVPQSDYDNAFNKGKARAITRIKSQIETLNENLEDEGMSVSHPEQLAANDVGLIHRLLSRFHKIVRQLKHRHADRDALEIKDEYDVQDLLHAMLRGLYDDVRPEEYTPSYAGGASRMDFLLKAEKIVIEAKVASPSLKDKQIGEQLLVDIARYQSHPDCRDLICFVYDPGNNLKNPAGLETDLSKTHGTLSVKLVIVSPT